MSELTQSFWGSATATAGLCTALLLKLYINRLLPEPPHEDYPEALASDPSAAIAQERKVRRA